MDSTLKLSKKERGEDLTNGKWREKLKHLKRGWSVMRITGCPEKSPPLMIEVVFLAFEYLNLGCPHLTPPTGRGGLHHRVGGHTGVQFAKTNSSP